MQDCKICWWVQSRSGKAQKTGAKCPRNVEQNDHRYVRSLYVHSVSPKIHHVFPKVTSSYMEVPRNPFFKNDTVYLLLRCACIWAMSSMTRPASYVICKHVICQNRHAKLYHKYAVRHWRFFRCDPTSGNSTHLSCVKMRKWYVFLFHKWVVGCKRSRLKLPPAMSGKILEWPSSSPDLNPVENLWWDLQKEVAAHKPKNINLNELEAVAHEERA